MTKAKLMRQKCCDMVLHGGYPDPAEVVEALNELEAERDALEEALREILKDDHVQNWKTKPGIIARAALAKLEDTPDD